MPPLQLEVISPGQDPPRGVWPMGRNQLKRKQSKKQIGTLGGRSGQAGSEAELRGNGVGPQRQVGLTSLLFLDFKFVT